MRSCINLVSLWGGSIAGRLVTSLCSPCRGRWRCRWGGVLDVGVPGPAPFGAMICSDSSPLDFDGVSARVDERVGAALVRGEVGEQL